MSNYTIKLQLPKPWNSTTEVEEQPDGSLVTHFEAYMPDNKNEQDTAHIDIYAGEMPPDTTAEDEALYNYADIIGWDENDPQESDPLTVWPFRRRKAYGFEGYCEDDSPMRVMCIELFRGTLVVISVIGKDDETLVETVRQIEAGLRVDREG